MLSYVNIVSIGVIGQSSTRRYSGTQAFRQNIQPITLICQYGRKSDFTLCLSVISIEVYIASSFIDLLVFSVFHVTRYATFFCRTNGSAFFVTGAKYVSGRTNDNVFQMVEKVFCRCFTSKIYLVVAVIAVSISSLKVFQRT